MFHGVGMLARAHDDGMGDEQLPLLLMLMAFVMACMLPYLWEKAASPCVLDAVGAASPCVLDAVGWRRQGSTYEAY